MTTTDSINSIGFCCQLLQRAPGLIRKAAAELKIAPVVTINSVVHFSDEQVETLRRHFAQKAEGTNG